MSSVDVAIRRQTLRALLVLTTVLAALAVGFATLLVVLDLAERGEDWDGFGMLIGAMLGVPSLVVGLLALGALRALRRDRARARWMAALAGGVLMLPMADFGGHWASWTVFVLGLGLVGAALAARTESPDELA